MKRNYTIDIFRIIAAFGVIAIHVKSDTNAANLIGNFFSPLCVPFFYTISLTYFVLKIKNTTLGNFLKKIFYRLMMPFIAWTTIYLILLYTKSVMVNAPKTPEFWRAYLYGESAVQLYFIPQLIMMQFFLFAIHLMSVPTVKRILTAAIILISGSIYLWAGYHYNCFGVTKPVTICFYIISAYLLATLMKKGAVLKFYSIAGFLIIFFYIYAFLKSPSEDISNFVRILPAGGVGLVLIAFNLRVKELSKKMANIATTSFGIYLSHIVFLEAIEMLLSKIFRPDFEYDFLKKIIIVSLIFTVAMVVTLVVRRIKFLPTILLGETSKV